jgi:hypothetical protein
VFIIPFGSVVGGDAAPHQTRNRHLRRYFDCEGHQIDWQEATPSSRTGGRFGYPLLHTSLGDEHRLEIVGDTQTPAVVTQDNVHRTVSLWAGFLFSYRLFHGSAAQAVVVDPRSASRSP